MPADRTPPLATVEQQLRQAAEMVDAGADLIDVGGESGRTDRPVTTPEESVDVLRRFDELSMLRRPLLPAASRKYFVGMITGRLPHQRLGGMLATVARGVDAGAHVVRVHDVAEVVAYLDVRTPLTSSGAPDFRGARADKALKWLPARPGGHA